MKNMMWGLIRVVSWPLVKLGELSVWLVRGKTSYGKIARQLIWILVFTFISLVFVFPSVINHPIAIINHTFESLDPGHPMSGWAIQSIPQKSFTLGLDLEGGVRIVYNISFDQIPAVEQQAALDSLRQMVYQRVDAFGVAEPKIYIEQGDTTRLVVELAGISDTQTAVERIGATPRLEFYEARPSEETTQLLERLQDQLSAGELSNMNEIQNPYYDAKNPVIRGSEIERASVVFDPNTGSPQVAVRFDTEGTKKFAEFTRTNIGNVLYIVLDDQIISGPVINDEISNGEAVISGQFTTEEAKELVDSLNAGALPVPITLASEQTIEASLGRESLDKSIQAALVGLGLVSLCMLLWYRLWGVIAVIALIIYSVLVLGLFKLLGFTLTLSGITGFVVSIGLAVDGNILIFERMKEELQQGRTFDSSLKEGFKRAWESIRDSQVSTLISSVILFYLASGVVQGFAVTLVLGSLISLFTAVTVTKWMLTLLGYQKMFLNTKLGKFLTFTNVK